MDNKGFVSTKKIFGLIMGVILVTVLFSVANSTVPTAYTAVHNLSDTVAADGAIIGTGPATLAGQIDDYGGWFWVLAFIMLAITVPLALLGRSRRRR